MPHQSVMKRFSSYANATERSSADGISLYYPHPRSESLHHSSTRLSLLSRPSIVARNCTKRRSVPLIHENLQLTHSLTFGDRHPFYQAFKLRRKTIALTETISDDKVSSVPSLNLPCQWETTSNSSPSTPESNEKLLTIIKKMDDYLTKASFVQDDVGFNDNNSSEYTNNDQMLDDESSSTSFPLISQPTSSNDESGKKFGRFNLIGKKVSSFLNLKPTREEDNELSPFKPNVPDIECICQCYQHSKFQTSKSFFLFIFVSQSINYYQMIRCP